MANTTETSSTSAVWIGLVLGALVGVAVNDTIQRTSSWEWNQEFFKEISFVLAILIAYICLDQARVTFSSSRFFLGRVGLLLPFLILPFLFLLEPIRADTIKKVDIQHTLVAYILCVTGQGILLLGELYKEERWIIRGILGWLSYIVHLIRRLVIWCFYR